jgi:hypothetical protein
MKKFRILLSVIFIFLVDNISLLGQCVNIELYSQEEVNNFIKKYGNCKTIQNLKIFDPKNDLVQFDSLYLVERIEGRFELQNIIEAKKNLDGFRNLKFVNQFDLFASNISNVFASLDTINHLTIGYDSSTFRALDNVKYIKNSLRFSPLDYCQSNHLDNFTTGPNFSLTLRFGNFTSTNCLQRFSNNIEKKYLKKLKLGGGYYDLSILNFIDSLETLILSSTSSSSDFSAIQKLTNLRHIEIEWDGSGNKYGGGFERTFHLDTLLLTYNKTIRNYYDIFPNLKTISDRVDIIGNDALINLDFLKNVTLPNDLNEYIAIAIKDNKLLNDCNVTFLCEALSKYPETVIIQNNGAKCTKEEIIKYCQAIGTTDINSPSLLLSPNPTYGYINIEKLEYPVSVSITNMSGNVVKTLSDIHHEIHIEDLPQGMYIFDIRNKDIHERHKIVKMD